MSNELTIKINDDAAYASVHIKDGENTTIKTVSVLDLINKLSKKNRIHSDILPLGTRYYSGNSKDFTIAIEIPPKVRTVSVYNRELKIEKKPIAFPPCLFIASVKDNRLISTKIFAVKRQIMTFEDELFAFPLGNAYNDGRICWGNVNNTRKIEKPIEITSEINLFFDSVFNGDLLNFNNNAINIQFGFNDLINYLKDREVFPSEALKSLTFFGKALKNE